MPGFMKNDEKKVEYVELIYDLIFVYMIGRNSSIVSHIHNGFISSDAYLTYFLCTLITIQIWYMATVFINRYGSNDFSEYVGLFINMFLLYYMGDATKVHWQSAFYRYNIAWVLIIVNMIVQYVLKYREVSEKRPWETVSIRFMILMLSVMSAIIIAGIALYPVTGIPLTPLAMPAGLIISALGRKYLDLTSIDFTHLTERIMLYIVFSFGEMIIAISGYFEGGFTINSFYFALCGFLIVVGLFMSYGFFYDHLLDREMTVSGNAYSLLHIGVIFGLNNLTLALEFMREPHMDLIPKNAYLIVSFVVYYAFLFSLAPFTKKFKGGLSHLKILVSLPVFGVLMAALYRHPRISILLSVFMAFWVWYLEYAYWRTYIIEEHRP